MVLSTNSILSLSSSSFDGYDSPKSSSIQLLLRIVEEQKDDNNNKNKYNNNNYDQLKQFLKRSNTSMSRIDKQQQQQYDDNNNDNDNIVHRSYYYYYYSYDQQQHHQQQQRVIQLPKRYCILTTTTSFVKLLYSIIIILTLLLSYSSIVQQSIIGVDAALFGPKSILSGSLSSSRTISSRSSSRSSSSLNSVPTPKTKLQQQQQQSSNTNSFFISKGRQQEVVVEEEEKSIGTSSTKLHLSKQQQQHEQQQQTIEDNTTIPSSSSSSKEAITVEQQQQQQQQQQQKEIAITTQQQYDNNIATISNTPSLEETSTVSSSKNEVITSTTTTISTSTLLIGGLSSRQIVLGATIGLLSLIIILAKIGIIGGIAPDVAYTNNEILYDCCLMVLTSFLGWGFVKLNTNAVKYNIIEPRDARKIIHTFSAPLFMILWPLFSNNIGSRYFAAIVPTINAIRLYLASQTIIGQTDDIHTTEPQSSSSPPLSLSSDSTTSSTTIASSSTSETSTTTVVVKQDPDIPIPTKPTSTSEEYQLAVAISRSGDVKEALGGPFIYVIMLLSSVILYWTDSVHGIMAMSCMAAGDGVADLFGRRYGKYTPKWTVLGNNKKSFAGTIAFIIASTITATVLIYWMHNFGYFVTTFASLSTIDIIGRIIFISIITSILEVIPFKGGMLDDNYIVPISAAILSMILFP